MNKSLYLECFSGISGDMFVAALLDLGIDKERLLKVLNNIKIDGFRIDIKRKLKAGIDVCDFDVILDKSHENHDHDLSYLHGPTNHEHNHESHHGHTHEHRGFVDIKALITSMDLEENVKKLAIRIFKIIAEAEAKAHNKKIEEVHFHEVGAVDSIVDIVAAAFCFLELEIDEVIVPVIYEGYGSVRCQHGILPIPVPATLNIISENKIKIKQGICEGELITPTGAAIVASIKTGETLPDNFNIVKVGLGGGKREYSTAGILRAMIIEYEEKDNRSFVKEDFVYKIESNIDDCSGEVLGYTMDSLLKAGALDVNYSPIYMKKNRPAYQLNVIVEEEKFEKIKDLIFRETSTIGIRVYKTHRYKLERNNIKINTEFGEALLKESILENGEKKAYPEYENVVKICKERKLRYLEVYNKILGAYNDRV